MELKNIYNCAKEFTLEIRHRVQLLYSGVYKFISGGSKICGANANFRPNLRANSLFLMEHPKIWGPKASSQLDASEAYERLYLA